MVMMMWEYDLRGLPTHHIQEGEGMCAKNFRNNFLNLFLEVSQI